MAGLGDIATIGHLLKRAYALMEGCRTAPEEIYLAREHVHAMALCLSGVSSDLYSNPRSFVHQSTDMAKTRQHALKVHIGSCDRALRRTEALLKTYLGFKGKHVSVWDRFRWSTSGKKEIAECKADLVMATVVLDMFLSREQLSVLWKLESMIEMLLKRIGALEALISTAPPPYPKSTTTPTHRHRPKNNVARTLILSLVLARLRKFLAAYRRRKRIASKPPAPSDKRPKPLRRTTSSFKPNPHRTSLVHAYASHLATTSPPSTPSHSHLHPTKPRPRPRTPSPDFAVLPSPRPIRRTSSLHHLSHPARQDLPQPYYECYRIGTGNLAFGPKTAPVYVRHRRGQAQLRRMAEVLREAGGIGEGDKRVRRLVGEKNKREKEKGRGRGKWYFVGGRVVGRDGGRTGVVSVEKVVVVLVRP